MTDRFDPHDLAPGDVLLYRGASDLSAAIRFFDGSEVSHASVHLGRGQIAEALGTGLARRGLAASLADADWTLVLRLKDPPTQMTPVRKRALRFVAEGHRYAYEQIVLLAFLCLTRRLPAAPALRSFVRGVLDAAAAALAKQVAAGSEPMICSEFVYRCYDEAVHRPDDAYSIVIEHGGSARGRARSARSTAASRPGVHPQSLLGTLQRAPGSARANRAAMESRTPPPTVRDLEKQFSKYLMQVRSGVRAPAPTLEDPKLAAATVRFAAAFAPAAAGARQRRRSSSTIETLFATAADFVTPGDLLRSESLITLGRLQGGASMSHRVHAQRTTHRVAVANDIWTLERIEFEVFTIVAELTPGTNADDIGRKTRFAADLGWDEWSLLRLVRPVREVFGVRLAAATVKNLKKVGELADKVWAKLEEAP